MEGRSPQSSSHRACLCSLSHRCSRLWAPFMQWAYDWVCGFVLQDRTLTLPPQRSHKQLLESMGGEGLAIVSAWQAGKGFVEEVSISKCRKR